MNQLIKTLVKECTYWSEGSTMTSRLELDEGKFARLIAQKCIDIVTSEANAYSEPTWAFEICNDIAETFGIDE